MKNLFKQSSDKSVRTQPGKPAVSGSREVQDFLQKVKSMGNSPRTDAQEARLVFSLDATASRQFTWDRASQLQAEMFVSAQTLGGLQVQLCYFRGLGEFYHSEWHKDPDPLLREMSRIHCQAGLTQIHRLLTHVLVENSRGKIRGVIYIGDAMEEDTTSLLQLAGQLGILQIPLFVFQERQDPVARETFAELARLSGGAYCQFDSSSAEQLRDLLRAVAIYAAGGLKALENFSKTSHQSVKLLGRQLK